MKITDKNLLAGGLLILFGFSYGTIAYSSLRMGSLNRVGSGFFPVMLGICIVGFGLAILLPALWRNAGVAPSGLALRGVAFVGLTPVVFGLTIERLGLAPSVVIASLLASCSLPGIGWRSRTVLSLGLMTFTVLLFHFGIGTSLPVFGSWFGG